MESKFVLINKFWLIEMCIVDIFLIYFSIFTERNPVTGETYVISPISSPTKKMLNGHAQTNGLKNGYEKQNGYSNGHDKQNGFQNGHANGSM